MSIMKAIPIIRTAILGAFVIVNHCSAQNKDYEDIFTPDINFANNSILEALPVSSLGTTRGTCSNAEEIVEILLNFNAINILEQDFYLRTNELNTRPLLDLPVFEPNRCCYPGDWVLTGTLFFNKTDKMHFDKTQDCLGAYLALSSQSLVDNILDFIENIDDFEFGPRFQFDVSTIFQTLQKGFIEERKAGLMLQGFHFWDHADFRWFTPIYWRERNFFINEVDQEELAEQFGRLTKKDQNTFAENNLISDTLGLGDTRAELQFHIQPFECSDARIGVMLTLPTAWEWATGIKGSKFRIDATQPQIDFCSLFNLLQEAIVDPDPVTQAQLFNEINTRLSAFFLDALDRLSATVLQAPLGNGKHFGLGVVFRNQTRLSLFLPFDWADNIYWKSRLSAEVLFAQTETRTFIKKNDPEQFAQRDFNDPAQANSNLYFLQQKFIDRLIPVGVKTRIKPSFILRSTSRFCYQGERFGFTFGSDWWVRTREHLSRLQESDKFVRSLDLQKAQGTFAIQSKMFGGIAVKFEDGNKDWFLSINADYTTFNRGIGHDYTTTLLLEVNF